MFSFMNCIGQLLSGLLTIVFTALFSLSSLLGGIKQELPKTPEDFTPVLRFVATFISTAQTTRTEKQNFRLFLPTHTSMPPRAATKRLTP